MRVLILGIDGYLGWPLALRLASQDHKVSGMDNETRRKTVANIGSDSLIPIASQESRLMALLDYTGDNFGTWYVDFDVTRYDEVEWVLRAIQPDTIIHFAEQPSAPYSMKSLDHAWETMRNNIQGTLNVLYAMHEVAPEAHLIKLGTMGEYGTPDCAIPEGFIPWDCIGHSQKLWKSEGLLSGCPMKGLPFPVSPGSFYHATKCHDSINIRFACRTWGLRATDIMQGVVYGSSTKETRMHPDLATRFDYDQYFGTVINRFCAQAVIGHPLTVYGAGTQKRSFLPIEDSMQAITLLLENPPELGEYRVVNQFSEIFSIADLARFISHRAKCYRTLPFPDTQHLPNPRIESEKHPYHTTNQKLWDLGYRPTGNFDEVIEQIFADILPHKDQIKREVIMPTTNWRD